MADADADLPCRFRWVILNLFVPERLSAATFYNGSPTLTQWQVVFVTHFRQIESWPFTFSLTNVRFGERNDSVVAAQLRVRFLLNGVEKERILSHNYSFSTANWYTFEFAGNFIIPLTRVTHHVTIEIQLSFPDRNIVNPRNELVPRERDLNRLSDDLRNLLDDNRFFNLRLISRGSNGITFCVHAYIIRARWTNFFAVHPAQTIIDDTVELNISNYILQEVLRYLYSGRLNTNGILRNLRLKTELFLVIDHYKLAHLYKVFVVDDSRQMRRTAEDLKTYVESLRMEDPPFGDRTFTWTVNPDDDYQLIFQIRFFLIHDVPSFYYILSSQYPFRLFVHLKLDFHREGGGFYTVHGRDYTIGATGTIASGICRFDGNPGAVDRFIEGIRLGEFQYFIRCTLYTSDGTAIVEIQDIESGIRLQVDVERLKVLSDHMYELYRSATDSDLMVSCPLDRPVNPYYPYAHFHLHRDLFTARVKYWMAILEDVTEADGIPQQTTCSMRSEAFYLFGAYIYSGKLFPIPARYLDEIHDFADRGGLLHLKYFVEPSHRDQRGL